LPGGASVCGTGIGGEPRSRKSSQVASLPGRPTATSS
jgi:hypothetical protein